MLQTHVFNAAGGQTRITYLCTGPSFRRGSGGVETPANLSYLRETYENCKVSGATCGWIAREQEDAAGNIVSRTIIDSFGSGCLPATGTIVKATGTIVKAVEPPSVSRTPLIIAGVLGLLGVVGGIVWYVRKR